MNTGTAALLREAAEWRLISLLLECPDDGWPAQVTALAAEISDADLKAAADAAQEEAGEGLYHTIFGPGGPAAPREVSYRETLQPGHLLSELAAYYHAFAYQPAATEPPDHVATETGFVAYLRMKQAYADLRGDRDHASIADEAAHRFIREHLNILAEPLAKALGASGIIYLSRAAGALLRRVGPRTHPPVEQHPPVEECLDEAASVCPEQGE